MKLFVLVIVVVLGGGALSYIGLSWMNQENQKETAILTPTEQAVALVQARGCVACHTLDGSKGIGPSWFAAWGSMRTFADGSTALVDAAYLRQSMQNPSLKVVQGFDNLMLPTAFTDAEMELVITLIRGLQQGNTDQAVLPAGFFLQH